MIVIFLAQGLKYCNDINYFICVVLPFTYIIIEDVYVKDDNEYKLLTVVSNDSISKEGRYVIDKEGKLII